MKAEAKVSSIKVSIFSLTGIKSVLIASMALVYLANVYIHIPYLDYVLSFICLLCILVCFPFIKGNPRTVSLLLFSIGSVMLFITGADLKLWLQSVSTNASLVTLVILVPIFGTPLNYGGYYNVLDALVNRYMSNRHRTYWVPAFLSHFFGALMNMGAIPVVYQLIIHGKLKQQFIHVPNAISRGFSSSIYWSPNMVSVAIVTHYFNVSWAEFARGGILFTLLSLLVGWLVHIISSKKDAAGINPPDREDAPINGKKVAQLIAFCSFFLGVIIIVATKTTFPVLNVVPLMALLYPVLWLGLLGKGNAIIHAYRDYFKNTLPRFTSELIMFLAAGFIASALLSTGSGDKISLFLREYIGLNPYMICFFVSSSVIGLSILGISPMVTVMAYSASLKPDLIGLPPELLSLVLVGGWAVSVVASPFAGVTLIMSGLTYKSPFEIARSNWLFGVIMIFMLSALPIIKNYF